MRHPRKGSGKADPDRARTIVADRKKAARRARRNGIAEEWRKFHAHA